MGKGRRNTKQRPPAPVTAAQLQRGRVGPSRTRIRLVRPGEAEHFDRLLRHTGVPLEPAAAAAIEDGSVSTALLAALDRGTDHLFEHIARALAAGDPARAFPALSLALVAADPDDRIVAALLSIPPGGLIAQALDAGLDPRWCLAPTFGITKIKGVAVDEQHRGAGIGAALLRRGVRLFFQLEFYLAFGQFRLGSGLENYYSRLGFEVLPLRAGVSLDAQFNLPMMLAAEPGEQMFIRWRGNPDRAYWERRW